MAQYRVKYAKLPREQKRKRESNWRGHGVTLTVEQFDVMAAKQGGKCAICRKPPPIHTRLHVDHNHTTGKVRGLLCDYCNRRLLIPRNTPKVLRRAADYLEKVAINTRAAPSA